MPHPPRRRIPRPVAPLRSVLLLACLAPCGCGGGAHPSVDGLVDIATHTLPAAATGATYGARILATGPHPPLTFLLAGGRLPPGLALDGESGEIAGWPRRPGTFRFAVDVRDGPDPTAPRDVTFAAARRDLTITVARGPLAVLPFEVPPGAYGAPFTHRFEAAGGTDPVVFEQAAGALPPGLSLRGDGTLLGIPTGARNPYRATLRARDARGATAERTFEVRVVVRPLVIAAATLPDAARRFPYRATVTLAPAGGGAPHLFAVVPGDGELPPGLGLDSVTGEIAGVPVDAGTYPFTLEVTDVAGQVARRAFSLRVNPGPALHAVTPPRARPDGGAVTLTGLAFQPGMTVTFGVAVPVPATVVDGTRATAVPPGVPLQSGPVAMGVRNPDGGLAVLPKGFSYPLATVAFAAQGVKGGARDASRGIDAGDVNGDGFADLVHVGAQGIEVIRPLGPTYANAWTTKVIRSDGAYNDVRLADVDRDGDLDIVAYRSSTVDTVEVYRNDGSGAFPGAASVVTPYVKPTSFHFPHSIDVGDVDGDGVPDVAFTSGRGNQGVVWILRGLGDGSFAEVHRAVDTIHDASHGCFGPNGVELADLDGDGRDDVLLADAFPSACAPGQSCPATGSPNTYPGANDLVAWSSLSGTGGAPKGWTAMRVGGVLGALDGDNACVVAYDHDGDGRLDAAVLGGYRDQRGCGIAFLRGDGHGGFSERYVKRTPYNRRFGARIDANLDGCDDLIVVGGDGTAASGIGNGLSVAECWLGGVAQVPTTGWVSGADDLPGGSIPGSNPGRVAVGDFDGDGLEDFAVDQSFNAKERFQNDQGDGPVEGVSVYLNRSR